MDILQPQKFSKLGSSLNHHPKQSSIIHLDDETYLPSSPPPPVIPIRSPLTLQQFKKHKESIKLKEIDTYLVPKITIVNTNITSSNDPWQIASRFSSSNNNNESSKCFYSINKHDIHPRNINLLTPFNTIQNSKCVLSQNNKINNKDANCSNATIKNPQLMKFNNNITNNNHLGPPLPPRKPLRRSVSLNHRLPPTPVSSISTFHNLSDNEENNTIGSFTCNHNNNAIISTSLTSEQLASLLLASKKNFPVIIDPLRKGRATNMTRSAPILVNNINNNINNSNFNLNSNSYNKQIVDETLFSKVQNPLNSLSSNKHQNQVISTSSLCQSSLQPKKSQISFNLQANKNCHHNLKINKLKISNNHLLSENKPIRCLQNNIQNEESSDSLLTAFPRQNVWQQSKRKANIKTNLVLNQNNDLHHSAFTHVLNSRLGCLNNVNHQISESRNRNKINHAHSISGDHNINNVRISHRVFSLSRWPLSIDNEENREPITGSLRGVDSISGPDVNIHLNGSRTPILMMDCMLNSTSNKFKHISNEYVDSPKALIKTKRPSSTSSLFAFSTSSFSNQNNESNPIPILDKNKKTNNITQNQLNNLFRRIKKPPKIRVDIEDSNIDKRFKKVAQSNIESTHIINDLLVRPSDCNNRNNDFSITDVNKNNKNNCLNKTIHNFVNSNLHDIALHSDLNSNFNEINDNLSYNKKQTENVENHNTPIKSCNLLDRLKRIIANGCRSSNNNRKINCSISNNTLTSLELFNPLLELSNKTIYSSSTTNKLKKSSVKKKNVEIQSKCNSSGCISEVSHYTSSETNASLTKLYKPTVKSTLMDSATLSPKLKNSSKQILNNKSITNRSGINQSSANDVITFLPPNCGDRITCKRCGRCRCSQCSTRTVCCGMTSEELVDCLSCMCLVKPIFYHCLKDDNGEEDCSEEPCACCSRLHCLPRWTLMAILSPCLPCLFFYLPLKKVTSASKHCLPETFCHCSCDVNKLETNKSIIDELLNGKVEDSHEFS